MKSALKSVLAAVGTSLVLTATVHAQEVTSQLEAYVVETTDTGAETFRKADQVQPGQLIEYRITYSNGTNEDLSKFIVNGDVPELTSWVDGSARTDGAAVFEVQLADLGWTDWPVFREIRAADGSIEKVKVPASDVEAIRWKLSESLGAGASVNTTYRVEVNQ